METDNSKTTKHNSKRPKVFFRIPRWIPNTILLATISILIIYPAWPHLSNAISKFQAIDLYKVGYRTVYTALNQITPLLYKTTSAQEANYSPLNGQYALENINFGKTIEEQENYQSNEYQTETSIESLNTQLRINSVNINGPVVDGKNEEALSRGFWFLPISPNPGEKGNTVIIGHRFLKIPPDKDTFFNLDKVQVGDQIEIEQRSNLITYTIVERKVVAPDAREVILPTNDYRLTLITCTPLWEDTNRLVVVAIQNEAFQGI